MQKKNAVITTCHRAVHSVRSINPMFSTASCLSRALSFPLHSEDSGLSVTPAAAQRLLVDDKVFGFIRGLADGQCCLCLGHYL